MRKVRKSFLLLLLLAGDSPSPPFFRVAMFMRRKGGRERTPLRSKLGFAYPGEEGGERRRTLEREVLVGCLLAFLSPFLDPPPSLPPALLFGANPEFETGEGGDYDGI